MGRLVHLNALQALEAVLRHGTLKAAARELGISQAAAGQRIRALEEFLGRPVLERASTGARPTRRTRLAMDDLRRGFTHLRRAAEALDLDREARVTVQCDPDWLALWLAPRLTRFSAAEPSLRLNLHPSDEGPLPGADLRIFFGTDPEGELLRCEHLAACVSPRLFDRVHTVQGDSKLEGFPLLHCEFSYAQAPEYGWREWVARFGQRHTGAERGPKYRSIVQAVRLAEAHGGALLCPLSLARDRIDRGLLRMLFHGGHLLQARNSWRARVSAHAHRRRSVVRFLGWLRAEYHSEASAAL